MSDDAVSVVQSQVDAYNARDLEAFLGWYGDGIRIEDGRGEVIMPDLEAMRNLYGQLFEQSPQLRCEVLTRVVVGDFVVDEESVTGFELEGYPDSLRAVAIYRVEGGKITHVRLLM